MVLEELKLLDLINMGETNHEYSTLTADVFRRRFSKFNIALHESYMSYQESFIPLIDNRLIIYNYNVSLLLLEHFGTYITDLEISYYVDQQHKVKEFMSYASKYCDNLVHLNLLSRCDDALDGITKPFYNVINVTLDGRYKKMGNDLFNLSEMFPKMKHFSLAATEIGDHDSLNIAVPHVESFNVRFNSFMQTPRYNEIKNFIMKNPQIRNLLLNAVNSSFIDFVSKNMPNLETLEIPKINEFDYEGDIHFKTVKKFTLGVLYQGGNILFDQDVVWF